MTEIEDIKWVSSHPSVPNFRYAIAPKCRYCNGNIKYVDDCGEYYIGGHSPDCRLFGTLKEYPKPKTMIDDWEKDNR